MTDGKSEVKWQASHQAAWFASIYALTNHPKTILRSRNIEQYFIDNTDKNNISVEKA